MATYSVLSSIDVMCLKPLMLKTLSVVFNKLEALSMTFHVFVNGKFEVHLMRIFIFQYNKRRKY